MKNLGLLLLFTVSGIIVDANNPLDRHLQEQLELAEKHLHERPALQRRHQQEVQHPMRHPR
jgi:hypothetical protein